MIGDESSCLQQIDVASIESDPVSDMNSPEIRNGPEFLNVGEHALSVQFGAEVDPAVNARVLALDRSLRNAELPGVDELVPTYRSLLIHFDPVAVSALALQAAVRDLLAAPGADAAAMPRRQWIVPVCYGGAFGEDLTEIASRHRLDAGAVVDAHTSAAFRVYMIGFAPGFAYLGGLPDRLVTPRRTEPRMWTPAGSVAIGGAQSSIASVAGPSGWHMIGRTPYASFAPGRDPVFLFQPGDEIRFTAIGPDDWHALAGRLERGELVPGPTGAPT